MEQITWQSARSKCDRCEAEKMLYWVEIPYDHEDGIWVNRPVGLCENCLRSLAEVCDRWWDDLPI